MRSKEVFGWILVVALVVTPIALWIKAQNRPLMSRKIAAQSEEAPAPVVPKSNDSGGPRGPGESRKILRGISSKKTVEYTQAFVAGDPLAALFSLPTPASNNGSNLQKLKALVEDKILIDEREKLLEYPERGLGCPPGRVRVSLEARAKQPAIDVCMDRYEYPNIPEEYPAVLIDGLDARTLCEADGGRLCRPEEWTGACVGDDDPPSGVYGLEDGVGEWTSRGDQFLIQDAVNDEGQKHCRPGFSRDPRFKSEHLGFRCCTEPRS